MDARRVPQPLVVEELRGALGRLDLAFHIAWTDTLTRYRRSVLGPFWLVLGALIGVGGLAVVWGTLFDVENETFVPMLSIGLVTWYLLSTSVTEAAGVFYSNRKLLLNMPVSSFLVSTTLLFRQLVNFLHNFVVVIAVLAVYPQHISPTALLTLPGLGLVCLNLLAVIHVIGYIGARYRDLAPLLAALIQPLFFLTPVMFRPEQLGAAAFIMDFNPFTHLLDLVRDPLMGSVPSITTWLAVVSMTVFSWGLALLITGYKRHRLAYWVN